jgi:hypothetical protein
MTGSIDAADGVPLAEILASDSMAMAGSTGAAPAALPASGISRGSSSSDNGRSRNGSKSSPAASHRSKAVGKSPSRTKPKSDTAQRANLASKPSVRDEIDAW